MRLANIGWCRYRVPLRDSFTAGTESSDFRFGLLIRITTNTGITGFGEASPIDILSYEENLLIKAECSARLGNDAVAQEALQEAQTAAETKWGFSADSFSDVSLTGDDLFNKILEEKYVALFLNLETWNDYKRNCYPNVSVADTKPPVRVYYPEDERKTNPNIPDVSSQPLNNDNDTEGCE